MALTKRERAILIEARRLIESKRESSICCALARVNDAGSRRLQRYIGRQLHPNSALHSWLESRHRINPYAYNDWRERMRATRLAWIDWMLDEGAKR